MATKTKDMSAHEAISAYGPARSTIKTSRSVPRVDTIDAIGWLASTLWYAVPQGQPCCEKSLKLEHIGLTARPPVRIRPAFTYIHFNRLINKYDLNAIFISSLVTVRRCPVSGVPRGPTGYPDKREDLQGQRLQAVFVPRHCSHATPNPPAVSMRR
jgi:xylulose-5-phosphate/fructose-6-phosphate phosphoketolase